MRQYRFYATLLDAFWGYLNSDVIWDKYWGFSDNPPHTPEEFHLMQFDELINRINRVPFDSEAADKGTAFNDLIDWLISDKADADLTITKTDYKVRYNNREFTFARSLCNKVAKEMIEAIPQYRVEAELPTRYGNVLVYGIIDELLPLKVVDLKTTKNYSFGKFRNNFQHLVYPYALMQNGSDIREFEYYVVERDRNIYKETYVFEPSRDIPILREHCEQFVEFLENNKELITDKKIFGDDC